MSGWTPVAFAKCQMPFSTFGGLPLEGMGGQTQYDGRTDIIIAFFAKASHPDRSRLRDDPAKSFTTINKYKCTSGRVFGIGKLIPKFLEVSPSLAPREKLLHTTFHNTSCIAAREPWLGKFSRA
eukprot:scaffold238052_cov35-Attheya_sp.AAC.1